MAKLSKKKKALAAKIEPGKAYSVADAVAILSEFATGKFKESLDVSVNLGIDARKSDQAVRGSTVLPAGTGKEVRVAVGSNQRCDSGFRACNLFNHVSEDGEGCNNLNGVRLRNNAPAKAQRGCDCAEKDRSRKTAHGLTLRIRK